MLTDEEFIEYCVNPAVRMRQQIRDELAKLDQEYKWVTIRSEKPDEFQMLHPEVKPEIEPENTRVDPLSPDREPTATTIDLANGQTGVSYEKLFGPYLRGVRQIRVVDPFVRFDYQIYNFMNFCEVIEAGAGEVRLTLVTCGESSLQEMELESKLKELQSSLLFNGIQFNYEFDQNLHDRWIEIDEWRILLGRGLDIYQKPEGKFTLGFVDQTKRRCKATTISYTRKKPA